jgi:hypothetical protein
MGNEEILQRVKFTSGLGFCHSKQLLQPHRRKICAEYLEIRAWAAGFDASPLKLTESVLHSGEASVDCVVVAIQSIICIGRYCAWRNTW